MSRFCTDWSESLDGDHRIHFVALELQVYQSMQHSDTAGGFSQSLLAGFCGTSAGPTMQLIHDKFICLQLTWSTCSAGCISELRRARGDLHELMQQVNQLQNRLGSTLETLASHDPRLAEDFGLIVTEPDRGPQDESWTSL